MLCARFLGSLRVQHLLFPLFCIFKFITLFFTCSLMHKDKMKNKYINNLWLSLCVTALFVVSIVIICTVTSYFKSPFVKIVWMYWEQGREHLKTHEPYNYQCVIGWKTLNPDWDIRILDRYTAPIYIPEMQEYLDSDRHKVQHRSDLLRIKLLSKYGGVWADVSTLPMKPLIPWIEKADNRTGIFFYRYIPKKKGWMISNWFIVAKQPNHYVINRLAEEFEIKMKQNKRLKYFTFHTILSELYDADPKVKNVIDRLTVTQDLSHQPHSSFKCKDVKQHPLVYKRAKKIGRRTYFKYLQCFEI